MSDIHKKNSISNFLIIRRCFTILSILSISILSASCSVPLKQHLNQDTFSAPSTPINVKIVPGDVVDVKFYYTPEINESQIVRPDGKISLLLLGDIIVSGKTPEQLRTELISLYTSELKNPEVVVILRTMSERRVYVGGEVNKPGTVAIPGNLTALEAIMEAGGFNNVSAKRRKVVLLRLQGTIWKGSVIDLSKPLKGNTSALCELQPRDIVYVPRTTIVEINQWVDQYINKVIPSIVPSTLGNASLGQWLIGKLD
jgi:protein involved in polysaccharide export with SLBB domain